ncbi:MAG: glycoside hydrolase family 48 protein [Oligoflexus sp.]
MRRQYKNLCFFSHWKELLVVAFCATLAPHSLEANPWDRFDPQAPARAQLQKVHGTGGIHIDSPNGQWSAGKPDLPQVIVHSDGFEVRTAKGESVRYPTGNEMQDRFFSLWWDIHNPENGYFSALDVPFHSVETLIIEAPDYGHLTTSEGLSYWVWLEAMFAHYTGDFSLLRYSLERIEAHAIPDYQPSVDSYNPQSPAQYARENPVPELYPSPLEANVQVGRDPLATELRQAYGDGIYGMHWLIDTENWYGFGQDRLPTYINTFQRGPEESVWETVPHPSIEDFRYGATNEGFLSLYAIDLAGFKKQWRYTNAPDADARLVQAMYWAQSFAEEQNQDGAIDDLIDKAVKMGDFLRYGMFDKYFKAIGCESPSCQAGQGYESAHYLLSWYYSWGGASPGDFGSWSWRIGSSHAHFGYQNPMAAYVLSKDEKFRPKTANGARDWSQSLQRQIEFYRWLQAANGGIAGGATSSWNGQYGAYPPGKATFYGMAFEHNPVFHDPGSNSWFGWQAWSMQRIAEYFYVTKDPQVRELLDRWTAWAIEHVQLLPDNEFAIPVTLEWQGEPETWNPEQPLENKSLSVTVTDNNQDVGITSSLAKTLMYYAASYTDKPSAQSLAAKDLAYELIQRLWLKARSDKGLALPEVRKDYDRFTDSVYVPQGYYGKMPDGSLVDQSSTFLSIRQQYLTDPDFPKVQDYLNGGEAPVFYYHRFWAQAAAALAYAEYDRLFDH